MQILQLGPVACCPFKAGTYCIVRPGFHLIGCLTFILAIWLFRPSGCRGKDEN